MHTYSEDGIEHPEHVSEIQDVLGSPPSWLLRFGMGLFLLLILILLAISWFVKYPDAVVAPAILTSYRPPVSLLAHRAGKISKLYAEDGQSVEAGQVLAVLENTARFEDLTLLRQCVTLPEDQSKQFFRDHLDGRTLNVGELQGSFMALLKTYTEWRFLEEEQYYQKQIRALGEQVHEYRKLRDNLHDQVQLQERDLSGRPPAPGEMGRSEVAQTVSSSGNKTDESYLTYKKNAYLSTNSSYIDTRIKIKQIEKSILDLTIEQDGYRKQINQQYRQHTATLLHELNEWQQKYVLVTPVGGRVAFDQYRTENQNVAENEEVVTVVPKGGDVFCQVALPEAGAGRVQIGQTVHIKMENFPYQEYGCLIGKVEKISALPRNSSYTARIALTQGLRTSYGTALAFRNQSRGSAEIITKDQRLIERMFAHFTALLSR